MLEGVVFSQAKVPSRHRWELLFDISQVVIFKLFSQLRCGHNCTRKIIKFLVAEFIQFICCYFFSFFHIFLKALACQTLSWLWFPLLTSAALFPHNCWFFRQHNSPYLHFFQILFRWFEIPEAGLVWPLMSPNTSLGRGILGNVWIEAIAGAFAT